MVGPICDQRMKDEQVTQLISHKMAEAKREKIIVTEVQDDNIKYCHFIVGHENPKYIKCLKKDIIAVSEVFECMFSGKFKESEHKKIELPDIEPEVFESFLNIVENGSYSIIKSKSIDILRNLVYFCKKYLIDELHNRIISEFKSRVTQNTSLTDVISIITIAFEFGLTEIINIFKSTSLSPNINIIINERYNLLTEPLVFKMNLDGFISLMNRITISERDRFNMIDLYIQKNFNIANEEDAFPIRKLLGLIDFTKMTPQEFINGPERSELLSQKTKHKLLIEILKMHSK